MGLVLYKQLLSLPLSVRPQSQHTHTSQFGNEETPREEQACPSPGILVPAHRKGHYGRGTNLSSLCQPLPPCFAGLKAAVSRTALYSFLFILP